MMKKLFFLALLCTYIIIFAATVPVECSTKSTSAVINEINTNADFIEIYLLQSSDINN